MKKININLLGMINKKYRRFCVGLVIFIFIIATVLTTLAIRQPIHVEEKVIENNIEEKTSFDFAAIVKPSSLYPSGGRVVPDKVIFNNLTEDFIISLNSEIKTDRPVRIEATKEVTYKLIAEKMWEREFVVSSQRPIKLEGTEHKIISEEVHLAINDINTFITKVEEETMIRPSYLVLIKPKIIGKVFDENNNVIYEIDNQLEIPFSLSGQYISYAGETQEKEFINTKTIEGIKIIPQYFNIFGTSLYINGARIGFGFTAIISLVFILLYLSEILRKKKANLTETYVIDKKNKNKIVPISNKINLDNIPTVNFKSIKDLLKVAEEKDETILKYEDSTLGVIYYYITFTSCVYVFKCVNVIKGSEMFQDA